MAYHAEGLSFPLDENHAPRSQAAALQRQCLDPQIGLELCLLPGLRGTQLRLLVPSKVSRRVTNASSLNSPAIPLTTFARLCNICKIPIRLDLGLADKDRLYVFEYLSVRGLKFFHNPFKPGCQA